MIEMEYNVSGVTLQGFGAISLKEKNGERFLAILVSLAEAELLESRAGGVSFPRPLTHNLILNVIGLLGARISYVLITKSKENDTVYAYLFLKVRDKEILRVIDCRAFDAVALCLNPQIPIYVEDGIFEEKGVSGGTNEEELKKLKEGPFGKAISGLDLLDDFGLQEG